MTDRTYSPSGWGGVPVTPGQHVLPGGGPLLPPMPLPPELPADSERCGNCDGDEFVCAACGVRQKPGDAWPSQVAPSCSKSGSSEDEVIPQAARDAARTAAVARWITGSSDTTQMLMSVDAALEAALPHLRPLFTTATRVGYELGRREAGEQIAEAIEDLDCGKADEFMVGTYAAAQVARDLTKGDSNG